MSRHGPGPMMSGMDFPVQLGALAVASVKVVLSFGSSHGVGISGVQLHPVPMWFRAFRALGPANVVTSALSRVRA